MYHSIEYAQYDSLQLGKYNEANQLLMRIESVVLNQIADHAYKGYIESMKEAEGRTWEQYRMYARQLIETYNKAPIFVRYSLPQPYGCTPSHPSNTFANPYATTYQCFDGSQAKEENPELNLPRSVLRHDLPDGRMNYAALAEAGATLVTGLSAAKNYAEEINTNGTEGLLLKMCIDRLNGLINDLEPRTGTMNYVKFAIKMFQEILLGVQDLAEEIKPYGFECYNMKNCIIMKDKETANRIRKKISDGHLKTATNIQTNNMLASPATPTLLFMPSYEIYGHILLLFDLYTEAKQMFEMALLERMGRVQSIVGLARSHAMIGNVNEATYFYTYLEKQLNDSDDNNPFLQEARNWRTSKETRFMLREQWKWPYL